MTHININPKDIFPNIFGPSDSSASSGPVVPLTDDVSLSASLDGLFAQSDSGAIPIVAYSNQVGLSQLVSRQGIVDTVAGSFLINSNLNSTQIAGFLNLISLTEFLSTLNNQFTDLQNQITADQQNLQTDSGNVQGASASVNGDVVQFLEDQGAYNTQLTNMQNQFPIDTANLDEANTLLAQAQATYNQDPTPANLVALQNAQAIQAGAQAQVSNDYTNYNAAATTMNNDINQYNTDLQNVTGPIDQYNADLTAYNTAVADYNTIIIQLNQEGVPGSPFPTLPPSGLSPLTIRNPLPLEPILTPTFTPPYPSLQSQPSFSSPPVISNPPVPALPTFSAITADIFQTISTEQTKSAKASQKFINQVAGVLLVDLINLFRNIPSSTLQSVATPSYVLGIGSGIVSAASSGLATLSLGLGNPSVASALSAALFGTAVAGVSANIGLNAFQLGVATGNQLVSAAFLILIEGESLLGAGGPTSETEQGLIASVINQILNQISNGTLEQSIVSVLEGIPGFNALTQAQQNDLINNLVSAASLVLGIDNLALFSSTSSQSSAFFQSGALTYYSNLSPQNISQTDVSTLNSTFDNSVVIHGTVEAVGNTTALQGYLATEFQQSNVSLNSQTASIVAKAFIQASLTNGSAIPTVTADLVAAGETPEQAANTAAALQGSFNNSVLGLFLASPNTGSASGSTTSVLNANVANEALDAISKVKTKILLDQLAAEGVQAKADQQGNLSFNINGNYVQGTQVFANVAQNLSTSKDQDYADKVTDGFNDFLKNSLKLDPNVLTQAVLAPGNTFTGIMYEGMKTTFHRASIDTRV